MTAPRYWKSPDGRRTVDLAAVVFTEDTPDTKGYPRSLEIQSTSSTTLITADDDEADSFLAALDAWRAREAKP